MYLEFFKTFLSYIDIPAIILGLMLCATWFMIMSARDKGHYDFSNMLRDENGKESITRIASITALAFSSWFVMYDTIHRKEGDSTVLLVYLAIWSGVKVAEKLVDAFAAKWAK